MCWQSMHAYQAKSYIDAVKRIVKLTSAIFESLHSLMQEASHGLQNALGHCFNSEALMK